jgi:hypothetical protein
MITSPIWFGSHYVRILSRFEHERDAPALPFETLHAARSFVARVTADPFGRRAVDRVLRGAYRRPGGRHGDDGVERAAHLLVTGELVVVPVPIDLAWAEFGGPVEDEQAKPLDTKAWVEFIVVDDVTGEPVGDIELGVELPKAGRNKHKTPKNGILTFDPCQRGTCTVDSPMDGAILGNTLEFVGFGAPTEKPLAGIPFPNPDKKPPRLVQVTHHHVTADDSLASLAKSVGMSWQDLAQYNFGTSVPKEINVALREQVGCLKKTKDRKNYVFDDSDDPGIVYLPRPFRLTNLSVDRSHTLRVRPLTQPPRPFYFSH